MKGTTNAQRNAIVDSTSTVDSLTLTKADGTTQKHTVSDMIPKDPEPIKDSAKFVTSGVIKTALDAKVSAETGKGLSTNDYTTAEKSKVANLPDNANNTFATKTELTNAVSSVYKYKGTKATYSALPSSGNTTGDVWNVTAANGNIPAGTNYAWNGSAWDALGGEIDLSGYVPTSRKVNGKALSGDITLAASDVSAVPTTRKVNNKALSADITLTAGDVGALATNGTAAKATADAAGNVITDTYATKSALTTGLAAKQNNLTFDSAPTSGSSNPVTSGGVYSAINKLGSQIPSGGEAGQFLMSVGDGSARWVDLKTNVKELSDGDNTIEIAGTYTILAIGGRGGTGGNGGHGGDGSSYRVASSGVPDHIGGAGGYGGNGGYGGYGYIKTITVELNAGDVLNITKGAVGNEGSKGSNGTSGETGSNTSASTYVDGTNGSSGKQGTSGGDTIVLKNGTEILRANGGTGGYGGSGGYGGKKATKTSGGTRGQGGRGGTGGNGSLYGNGGTGGYGNSSGSNGSDGRTYSPNSTSEYVTGSDEWATPLKVFDEAFIKLSELLIVNNTTNGRVIIKKQAIIGGGTTFPL